MKTYKQGLSMNIGGCLTAEQYEAILGEARRRGVLPSVMCAQIVKDALGLKEEVKR